MEKTERVYSTSEVAKIFGLTVEELTESAKEAGLIDEDGNPTQYAIDNGLLFSISDTTLN